MGGGGCGVGWYGGGEDCWGECGVGCCCGVAGVLYGEIGLGDLRVGGRKRNDQVYFTRRVSNAVEVKKASKI